MINISTATPLLLLLDGMLSRRQDQVQEALDQYRELIGNNKTDQASRDTNLTLGHNTSLEEVVLELLDVVPSIVSVVSSHDGSLPLHFAASIGDVRVVEAIYNRYEQAALTPNHKGKLPIHYAAREGRETVVFFLLKKDPRMAAYKTQKQKLPLHYSVGDGHRYISQLLLQAYPSGSRETSSKGKLPVHFAARWGHLDILNDLLREYPEGVKCLDWDGSLPLHEACRQDQREMAAHLICLYPDGIRTENIRGELPLFTAVRNGSIELVAQLVYAWPEGGRMMIKSVIEEDNVEDWDWELIELCLRGAVNKLENLNVMKQKFPSLVFSSREKNINVIKCDQSHQINYSQLQPRNSTDEVSVERTKNVHRIEEPLKPCKRPCLGRCFGNRAICICRAFSEEDKSSATSNACPVINYPTPFLALHAAIEITSNKAIMARVLERHADQVSVRNASGSLPIHLLAKHSSSEQSFPLMRKLLSLYPKGVECRDYWGRLPLHVALRNKAHISLVQALLEADKASGFTHCLSHDIFQHTFPVFMASYFDCDLDVLYVLLRGDPGIVRSLRPT